MLTNVTWTFSAATERFDHRVGGHVHLRLQHLDTSILVRDCAHYASLLTSLKQTTLVGNRTGTCLDILVLRFALVNHTDE